MKSLLLASAAAILLAACATGAPGPSLTDAIERADAVTLRAALPNAAGPEADLARGTLLALERRDDDAIAALTTAAADTRLSADARSGAWSSIAGIRLRQGRFADAADAFDAASALAPLEASSQQARVFSTALHEAPAMRADIGAGGALAITRDLAQLARTDVIVNGVAHDAVLDTGAGYSTISETWAARMGLRVLDATVSVGSATMDDVPARVAIAERLTLGGAEFHDVLFIVFPDEALSFADGAYVIDAIVGLPVLMQLGRLEFARDGETETLRYGRSAQTRAEAPNLLLQGLQPVAVAQVNDATLRLLIDSGARRTSLNQNAVREFPALTEGASTEAHTVGGAGGSATHDDALALAPLTITIGAVTVPLPGVRAYGGNDVTLHGAIGQDLLRHGRGYVLDFDAMRFELLE